MTREQLVAEIKKKKSFLCVGLDTDLSKIPVFLLDTDDPIFEFNKAIIDATKDYCVAYKPNIAFYESLGEQGWISLRKTLEYIPKGIFTIADAKRGDIGNTSNLYAKAFFESNNFDSITVAPYMGEDSVTPFLAYPNKWVILLALTSNKGALDFQQQVLASGERVFEKVLDVSTQWGNDENLMYVVGATRGEEIGEVRKRVPNHFFLVPGVGAQGGSLSDVVQYGMTKECGLLVNSSRGIIYSSSGKDFDQSAQIEAEKIQLEMAVHLKEHGII
jgi:orotidine-5'-phosphate decarboxylase